MAAGHDAQAAGERVEALLAEDAEVHSDGGGKASAARVVIRGRDKAARFLTGVFRKRWFQAVDVATVTGEPGLGKTALVEEFLAELAAGGASHSVARGRCSERLAGAEAYLPFLEALDSLLQGEGGASAAQRGARQDGRTALHHPRPGRRRP